MANLELMLEKQLLTLLNSEVISSGDVNVDFCSFKFDASWNGYVKTAVFYQDKNLVQYAVLGSDNTCQVPAAAVAVEGNLHIGVFGVNGSKVLTSTMERVYIRQGAVSGAEINVEPADDVFLAIIAQYQRILEMMQEYEEAAAEAADRIEEQNRILETLHAFDIDEITQRMDLIEDRMASYANTAKSIMDREVILRDVQIQFTERVCRIESDRVSSSSLCDVYFDEFSYETASRALILPVSHDGYIELTSSVEIKDALTANILVRRY